MKNAEDYFKKYGNRYLMIGYSNLSKILTEHDNEIISEIEKKIKEYERNKYGVSNCRLVYRFDSKIEALTEIINLIKET